MSRGTDCYILESYCNPRNLQVSPAGWQAHSFGPWQKSINRACFICPHSRGRRGPSSKGGQGVRICPGSVCEKTQQILSKKEDPPHSLANHPCNALVTFCVRAADAFPVPRHAGPLSCCLPVSLTVPKHFLCQVASPLPYTEPSDRTTEGYNWQPGPGSVPRSRSWEAWSALALMDTHMCAPSQAQRQP